MGLHPPPSVAGRAASAIRDPEGLWRGTGGAAAARAGLESGAELPGREAGPPQASALGLPGLRMKLMLTIKYVAAKMLNAKALSCSSGERDILRV